MKISMGAQLTELHRLVLDNNDKWRSLLRSMRPGRMIVELQPWRSFHTKKQRNYHWGVAVKFFQDLWSKPRTDMGLDPYTLDETHYALVLILRGSVEGPMGTRIPVPTHDMTTTEYAELDRDIRKLAWDQYQARLPEPGESWEDQE